MRSYAQAQAIHDRAVLAARDADLVQLLVRPRTRRIRQWGRRPRLQAGRRCAPGGAASPANPVSS